MNIDTKNRQELKSYFVKNAIPTELNFADFINAGINQKDDGVIKLVGNPLSIQSVGDIASEQKVLNFYSNLTNNAPDWTFNLNPRTNTALNDNRPGFGISDGAGNNHFFIAPTTGNVGIGTNVPGMKLDVNGNVNIRGALTASPGNALNNGITFPPDAFGGAGDRAWIRYHNARGGEKGTLEFSTANDPDDHIALMPSGNVGIGTADPSHKLHVRADSAVGLFESISTQAYLRISTSEGLNNRVELANRSGGRLALFTAAGGDVLNVTQAGNVGIGSTAPLQKLVIEGTNTGKELNSSLSSGGSLAIKSTAPQIDFIDIDNNHGDWAIHVNEGRMYFIRQPWNHQDLVLDGTGKIGIGTVTPTEKLTVTGFISAYQVYFSAYLATNTLANQLDPLPMQVVSQNVGNAYNTTSSRFTAPVEGLYLFTMTGYRGTGLVTGDTTNWLHWYLMVNNTYANQGGSSNDEFSERGLISWGPNESGTASRTVILKLKSGDTVHVQQAGIGRCDNYRSGLEGVLLGAGGMGYVPPLLPVPIIVGGVLTPLIGNQ